jgi:hypothetical protein
VQAALNKQLGSMGRKTSMKRIELIACAASFLEYEFALPEPKCGSGLEVKQISSKCYFFRHLRPATSQFLVTVESRQAAQFCT